MENQVREAIDTLNEKLAGQFPFKIEAVNPKDIRLVEKNARYMTNEMFENLVANIKRDGNLSSLPLCKREKGGGLRALSGNHRVMAAVKAGLSIVLVLVIEKDLTRDEEVAIQLSHNAIAGKDDPVLLKELWDEIQDLALKVYAGLDTELVKKLDSMQFDAIAEARLDFKTITFLFLPEEEERLKEVLEKADAAFAGDATYLAGKGHYAKVFDAIIKAKEGYNIVNNPTAMMKLLELAEERMGEKNIDKPV